MHPSASAATAVVAVKALPPAMATSRVKVSVKAAGVVVAAGVVAVAGMAIAARSVAVVVRVGAVAVVAGAAKAGANVRNATILSIRAASRSSR